MLEKGDQVRKKKRVLKYSTGIVVVKIMRWYHFNHIEIDVNFYAQEENYSHIQSFNAPVFKYSTQVLPQ